MPNHTPLPGDDTSSRRHPLEGKTDPPTGLIHREQPTLPGEAPSRANSPIFFVPTPLLLCDSFVFGLCATGLASAAPQFSRNLQGTGKASGTQIPGCDGPLPVLREFHRICQNCVNLQGYRSCTVLNREHSGKIPPPPRSRTNLRKHKSFLGMPVMSCQGENRGAFPTRSGVQPASPPERPVAAVAPATGRRPG